MEEFGGQDGSRETSSHDGDRVRRTLRTIVFALHNLSPGSVGSGRAYDLMKTFIAMFIPMFIP
jgi:hypothetical protein